MASAIQTIWRDCPSEDIYIQFGDGSIYLYPAGVGDARTVRHGLIHGRVFNLPAVRRFARRPGPGYERVEEVPSGALVLYDEPPYTVQPEMPECEVNPETIYTDADFNAWTTLEFSCTLSAFTQSDPDNYGAGGCGGPAFLSNFGAFWRLNWNGGNGDMSFDSDGTSVFGPYNLVTTYFGPNQPPADWFFQADPP